LEPYQSLRIPTDSGDEANFSPPAANTAVESFAAAGGDSTDRDENTQRETTAVLMAESIEGLP